MAGRKEFRGSAKTKVGVMVCGHGSRDEDAVREFEAVAAGIRARLPQYQVESGFLEFARPIIRRQARNWPRQAPSQTFQ